MDLYAEKAGALPQKLTVIGIELALILVSAWMLFGGPADEAIPARRWVLFAFSAVIFVRMSFTMLYLMKRRMPWSEAATIPFAFALYYVGFAVLILPHADPLGPADDLAIALFALGCFLNTGSELQRHGFKARPENAGKLYTEGLFAWSMHINFFGDILWVAAYAVVAHSIWAAAIPLVTLSFFVFYNIPLLDKHLAEHYGAQFDAYAARTKRLIPFVW
ncbi:MAG: DUF1295 domain-containing protein [Acidobacteria bacterium]|nr:DUF1295 domain-containing protein [Acidobacteriota bacterium]